MLQKQKGMIRQDSSSARIHTQLLIYSYLKKNS